MEQSDTSLNQIDSILGYAYVETIVLLTFDSHIVSRGNWYILVN